jgi:hypothetical protein
MTHGFFALMGGFVLYVDDQRRGALTPDELLKFVRDESVERPAITQAEINDRSKTDFFAKCIAILRTSSIYCSLEGPKCSSKLRQQVRHCR